MGSQVPSELRRSSDDGDTSASRWLKHKRELRDSAEVIPGLLATATLLVLALEGGGFSPEAWYPAGLFMLGLLVLAAVVYRGLGRLSTVSALALALFAAFVAWSFLSIFWADQRAIAWDGANRSLFYLLVFALFLVLPWRSRSAAAILVAYVVGLACVGVCVLAATAWSSDPSLALIGARFAEPTDYANGAAALFLGGFWPATALASRREAPWLLRGLLLGCAGVLMQLALLPQSRGAFIVFPFAAVAYVLLIPGRPRALLPLILVLGATALAAPPILDVFTVADSGADPGDALSAALDAVLISFVGLFAVGAALAALDRRVEISEKASRVLERSVTAGLGACAAVAVAVALLAVGNPADWADDRWQDFKGGYDSSGFGSSRFTGDLGSNRYDFWRVSVGEQFASAPVAGQGADNFAVPYLRERTSPEEPLYPHSLPLRVLAGTGLIGGLLFLGALGAACVAAARARFGVADAPRAVLSGVALVGFTYWVLHSAGDWLWSLPAVTAPIFAWLGVAASLGRPSPVGPAWGSAGTGQIGFRRRLALVAGGCAVALTAVTFLLPLASARDVSAAARISTADPEAALDRLDRARGLNFLSAQPDLRAGVIATAIDDPVLARRAFTRALEREPSNWYATLQLATLDLQEGQASSGQRLLELARELNPRDPLIRLAVQRARSGSPLTLQQINQRLLRRLCAVVGRTSETRFCR